MAMTSRLITVVTPANHVAGPKQGHWTYDHYAALPDDGQRYEVIDGVLYLMPWPTLLHQSSCLRFSYYLFNHINLASRGKVYIGPVDVVLAQDTVVQPDVIVVLKDHFERITDQYVFGASDLVVEIAPPDTSTYDRNRKYTAYARAGVSEYWIADPVAHTVEVLILETGTYTSVGVFSGHDTLPSVVVPDIKAVRVEQFFV